MAMEGLMQNEIGCVVVTGDFFSGRDLAFGSKAQAVPIHVRAGITTMVEEGVGVIRPLDMCVVVDLDGQPGRVIEAGPIIAEENRSCVNPAHRKKAFLTIRAGADSDLQRESHLCRIT